MLSTFSFLRKLINYIMKFYKNFKSDNIRAVNNYMKETLQVIESIIHNGKHCLFSIAYDL